MKENVGGWDRNIRWILGAGALVAAFTTPLSRGWRIGLLAFGATEFFTAGSRFCPVNEALGINTAKGDLAEAAESAVRTAEQSLTA